MAMRRRLWRMGGRVLNCFAACVGAGAGAGCGCLCARVLGDEVEERKALVSGSSQVVRLSDLIVERTSSSRTLGFHLQPKTVELRVSMHCYGCAKKVHKHISKMEGVTWFEVDLEHKKVVVTGDVTPLEVLQSVSKVKLAQLWMPPQPC
ncbi:hypothetical protein CFC21_003608 [Triticum aestivum]|uniref:HMA domain-containing protein n=3 Tax=Triticum TaxID=4564 RepID=A0A9R0V2E6_TRITD|nr:uncharacterized protein LOC119288105 [Triticum dicoccoides]XP_044447793.1 uncharacterized protein LOC123179936 [Triticum aestivum]XP_048556935.1 uncharacterized protein LOC125537657 [Triticum urartu]KAF6985793.1 hypothetical protein CFC21_003608 [Triticum aestivum]VAH09701.1 unnamed protein product [Triticum turgidum subsp. durum]